MKQLILTMANINLTLLINPLINLKSKCELSFGLVAKINILYVKFIYLRKQNISVWICTVQSKSA